MALQYNLTMDNGIVLTSAYARISSIYTQHNLGINQHNISIEVYKDINAYNNNLPVVTRLNFNHDFDPAMPTSFADIYTYLKTLPVFAGAIDV